MRIKGDELNAKNDEDDGRLLHSCVVGRAEPDGEVLLQIKGISIRFLKHFV